MSAQANYFKLGMFILSGTAILILALIALGIGSASKDKLLVETYFKDSVQGIDVGSPVKFLGVKVGTIEQISFAFDRYRDIESTPLRYVMVVFALDPDMSFGDANDDSVAPLINAEVNRGLRIKVAPQGLTGTAYLEMTYVDPAKNPPLPVDWKPYYFYIPSVPGAFTRLQEALQTFSETMEKIRGAGIEKTVDKLNALLDETRSAVKGANVAEISAKVSTLVSRLEETNGRIDEILNSKEFDSTIKDLSQTMANVKTATGSLPQALDDMRRLLMEVADIVTSQRGQISSILRNTNETMENFNELSGDAKKNPARLFWGAPPARKEP